MNLNEFSREVHKNAVNHGWWETERDITETMSLIHSEWSEALEEYRADRPMVWFECDEIKEVVHVCDPKDKTDCLMFDNRATCPHRGNKPEGIAVELIDGCIRILDLFRQYGYELECSSISEMIFKIVFNNPALTKNTKLPTLVFALHGFTAKAGDKALSLDNKAKAFGPLEASLALVFFWVSENGIDPEKLMLMKHKYNKTRPYRHGNKAC